MQHAATKNQAPRRYAAYAVHGLRNGASRIVLVLLLQVVVGTTVLAQNVTLRGFITDQSNGAVLAGANVTLQHDQDALRGTVSNEEGYYQLNQIPPGSYVLHISFIGYTPYIDTLQLGEDRLVVRSVALVPGETLEEIVVEREGGAATLEGSLQQVRPADLARIPTPDPSGDLATYLQTLPGVVSLGDRGGQLYIRGGTPSQNLVLLDGTLIYQPFHIIGFFSAFPQELVSSVDVFAGGFGARYSGRLSSVIDVSMRSGNTQRVEGAASVGPFLAGARLEGPLRKGSVSLLGSVRTSVIEQMAPTLLGEPLPLRFSDIMVKIQDTGVGRTNNRCSLTGIHTYDRGRIGPAVDRPDVFRWSNSVLAGHCAGFTPSSAVFIEANSGFSYVKNTVGASDRPERSADAWLFNSDVHWTFPLNAMDVEGGLYLQIEGSKYNLEEQFQGLRRSSDFNLGAGMYMGATIPLGQRLNVNPSMALTYPLSYAPSLEPRLRLAWHPWGSEAQTLSAALGLYRQTVEGINDERDVGSVFTVWMPAPVDEARSRALHALVGWQQQIGPFNLATEGYYKNIHNLPVPIWSVIARFTTELTLADGDIYGLDTRIEFRHNPLYAYLGYGYSWTKYTTAQDNFGLWFDEPIQSYHPPHDRRHQLHAILSLDAGLVQASVRWQYGSGLPYTQALGTDSFIRFINLPDVRRIYGNPRFLYDRPYQGRLPTYHRLDVSVERAFDLRVAELTLQAGSINIYDRANLFYFDLFTFRRVDQLPFLPYLSLLVEVR